MTQCFTPMHTARSGEYFLQTVERYIHTDNENGAIFNIARLRPKQSKIVNKLETAKEDTTTTAYLKMTIRYKRNTALTAMNICTHNWRSEDFGANLPDNLRWLNIFDLITAGAQKLDTDVSSYFATENNREMRHGCLKQDFISILIDPRVSCNLPGESIFLDDLSIWKRFLCSIFYVGVASADKPYCHLWDALKLYQHKKHETSRHRKKHQRILDIWHSSYGVVCLGVYPNTAPKEAYTRKSAITELLGLSHLLNSRHGDFHGPPKMWPPITRTIWGTVLLHTAMQCYLKQGEIQVFPTKGHANSE